MSKSTYILATKYWEGAKNISENFSSKYVNSNNTKKWTEELDEENLVWRLYTHFLWKQVVIEKACSFPFTLIHSLLLINHLLKNMKTESNELSSFSIKCRDAWRFILELSSYICNLAKSWILKTCKQETKLSHVSKVFGVP